MKISLGLSRFSNCVATVFLFATLTLSMFSLFDRAEARTFSPQVSDKAMTDCQLASDAERAENDKVYACCSKKTGTCVICPKIKLGDAPPMCEIRNYRSGNPLGNRPPRAGNGGNSGQGSVNPDGNRPPNAGGGNDNPNNGADPGGGRPDLAGGAGMGADSVTGNTGNGGIN